MNILLIAPPLFIKKTKRIFPRFPPFVILSVAAQLEKADFKIKIYDAYLESADKEDIKKEVDSFRPSLIGISPADITRFPPIEVDIALIKFLKFRFPNIPIVVFGLGKEDIIRKLVKDAPEIDYLFLGDPEEAIVELAQCIARKDAVGNINGLVARHSFGIFSARDNVRVINDLDKLFFPAWHLIDLNRYSFLPHRYKVNKAYPILTARGCPWNRCIFCKEISTAGLPPYRTRSAENVVSEVEFAIKKYGASEIQFYDTNFNTDIEWLRKFQAEIIMRDISFSWSCLTRVDRLNKEAVAIMRDTGCWNMVFGIESNSQHLLDIIDKGISVDQVRKAVSLCNDSGIQATGSFLIGLPYEKPKDVINSAKFAVDIGLDYAQFFIAKWHDYHKQFISQGELLKGWDYSQFDFRGPVFIPNNYKNFAHLKAIQRKAYLIFYTHPRIILKHLKKINSFNEIKRLLLAIWVIIKISLEKIVLF